VNIVFLWSRVALSEDIVEGVDPVSTPMSFPQEGQAEANNCGQNYLWTDRYQPQTSKQVKNTRFCTTHLRISSFFVGVLVMEIETSHQN
jgi:hypothetical protein